MGTAAKPAQMTTFFERGAALTMPIASWREEKPGGTGSPTSLKRRFGRALTSLSRIAAF